MLHRIWLPATLAACLLLSTGVATAQDVTPAIDPVAAAPVPATELADPTSGPAVVDAALADASAAVETPQDRVVEAWRVAPPTPHSRTVALRRLQLEYGLGDLLAPAQVVLATGVSEEIGEATDLARALAPQMPALQWVHVKDLWRGREAGAALKAFGEMVWDAAHQLPTQLWLLGNGLLLLWIVALVSTFAFMLMLGLKAFSHAAHDLGDVLSRGMPVFARWALLAGVALVPIWLGEGLAGLALVCFAIAYLYGKGRERGVLVMAATLWIVALHPLAQWASIATTVVELDPITRSALAVTKGIGTRADVERLEAAAGDDLAAAHALAYRARRFGMDQLEMAQLDAMAERWPADPVSLANRATIDMRAGRTEAAVDGFERAATQLDSPTLLFDLSQAYASLFRMDEYEATLEKAQRIDDREIQALSSLSDPKLVADLAFPIEILRDRLRTRGLAGAPSTQLTEWIAPGRLGTAWSATAIAFAAVLLVSGLFGGRFDRSSLCTRCGHRICTRCEATVWSDELCEDCHHLFKNPEATDPKLRMARLQALSRRESRIQGLIGIGSFVVPGIAGMAMRRPDLALLGIGLFAWIAIWARWPAGVLVDPLWLGPLAPLCFSVLGSVVAIAYAAIVVGSLVASRNR